MQDKDGAALYSTNAYGRASFRLPNGTYKVQLSENGYDAVNREITVSGGNKSVSYAMSRLKYPVKITVASETVELVWTRVPDVTRYKVMTYVDGKYELVGATRQRCRITLTGLDPDKEYGFLVRGVLMETPKRVVMTPYAMDDISCGSPNS